MQFKTASSLPIVADSSVSQLMHRVLYAMIPGIMAQTWLFGWGILINIGVASATALTAESLMLAMRSRPIKHYLGDGSALVTAWLLAAALPALGPWWLAALGAAFAIVVGKHLYGGLGYNPFNPAMVGYAALLVSFPREMSTWPALQHGLALDAVTGATPLDSVKTQLGMGKTMAEIAATGLFGALAGRGWEWVSVAYLSGGLWLVYTRTAAWQIPAAMLASMALLSGVFFALNPQTHASPWFHLMSVSSIYGAFFVATDPVSASTTPRGRLLYGTGIGILTYIIRALGGYPDGVAFAVLLMNIAVPTIDYYTQPRVFGVSRGR